MTRDVLDLCIGRVSTSPMNVLKRSLIAGDRIDWPGRTYLHMVRVEGVKENLSIHPDQPRASSPINDNYCLKVLQTELLAGNKQPTPGRTMNILSPNPVLTAPTLSQKKDLSPGVSGCYQNCKLKYVKDVFCVDQLSFVKPLNVQHAASNLPVGASFKTFGKLGWI